MTNHALAAQMQQLKNQGMTQAQIARQLGCAKSYVNRLLGANCDVDQWERDRQAAIDFFRGLAPRHEYDLHALRRAELKMKYPEELI